MYIHPMQIMKNQLSVNVVFAVDIMYQYYASLSSLSTMALMMLPLVKYTTFVLYIGGSTIYGILVSRASLMQAL